jgi:hypothetical protein
VPSSLRKEDERQNLPRTRRTSRTRRTDECFSVVAVPTEF